MSFFRKNIMYSFVFLFILSANSKVFADNTSYEVRTISPNNPMIRMSFQYAPRCYAYFDSDSKQHLLRQTKNSWIVIDGLPEGKTVQVTMEFFDDPNTVKNINKTQYGSKVINFYPQYGGRYHGDFGSIPVHHSVESENSWTVFQKIKVTVNGTPLKSSDGSEWFKVPSLNDESRCYSGHPKTY